MRAAIAIPLFLVPLLAGCLGGGSDNPSNAASPLVDADADGKADLPLNNTTLPTLGPAVDPWAKGETERLLVEATVDSQPPNCTGPADTEIWAGCVNLYLPDGVLVPEGTAALRIEADASGAQRVGKWGAFVMSTRTRGWVHGDYEWATGAPTAEPTGVWRWPLEPFDWDHPLQASSSSFFHFMGHGEAANGLVGQVSGRVIAERDMNWTPQAPLDHFRIHEMHRIPQAGVISLLERNVTFSQAGAAAAVLSGRDETFLSLEDIVPTGTRQVVVAASWGEVRGCPPTMQCSMRIDVRAGHWFYGGYSFAPIVEVGPAHVIYVYEVPRDLSPTPDHADESGVSLFGYPFNQCPQPVVDEWVGDCKRTFTDVSVDMHYLVEAWNDEVDLEAFKARLEVA